MTALLVLATVACAGGSAQPSATPAAAASAGADSGAHVGPCTRYYLFEFLVTDASGQIERGGAAQLSAKACEEELTFAVPGAEQDHYTVKVDPRAPDAPMIEAYVSGVRIAAQVPLPQGVRVVLGEKASRARSVLVTVQAFDTEHALRNDMGRRLGVAGPDAMEE